MNSKRVAVSLAFVGLLAVLVSMVLWIAREKPVNKQLEIEVALANLECSCLLPDGNFIYVGGVDGLFLLDAATLTIIEEVIIPGGPVLQLVSALYKTPDGALWVAHNRGISVRIDDKWRTFDEEDGLLDLRANCFCPDTRGGLWAGTWGGAYYFAETNGDYTLQKSLTMENGLTDNMIYTIAAVGEDLWYGAYYHTDTPCGLSILGDGRFSYISVTDGLPHSFITAICPTPSGEVYVGCGFLERGGLAVVREREGVFEVSRVYTEKEGLPGPKVRTLYYDSDGRLWVATENDGILIVLKPNDNDTTLSGAYAKKENGLPDNEIKQILEYNGHIYLAARVGIARLPLSAVTRYCDNGSASEEQPSFAGTGNALPAARPKRGRVPRWFGLYPKGLPYSKSQKNAVLRKSAENSRALLYR